MALPPVAVFSRQALQAARGGLDVQEIARTAAEQVRQERVEGEVWQELRAAVQRAGGQLPPFVLGRPDQVGEEVMRTLRKLVDSGALHRLAR